MRRASPPTIPGCRSPGWSPARPSAACSIYPQRNCLDRETALRMWTENVTWFSNEEGKKGRIEAGQLADLIVPDRDYFACAEDEIAGPDLGADDGRRQDRLWRRRLRSRSTRTPLPPAMPDWSPVRTLRRLRRLGRAAGRRPELVCAATAISTCGCASACGVHGHDHAAAWTSKLPIADLKGFWGALGCSCWAV